MNLVKLRFEDACRNKPAARFKPIRDAPGLIDQEVASQIGANHVEFRSAVKGQASQVLLKDANLFLCAVLKSICHRNADGGGVEVESLNRTITQLGRRDG